MRCKCSEEGICLKSKKVIVFPGMIEKLIEQGKEHAEHYRFTEAVTCFEQALTVADIEDERVMFVYACALHELKQYEKTKQICEELMKMGTNHYWDVVELYIATSVELKNFKQVETLIHSLFEEQAIPVHKKEQFERLQSLNQRLASNQTVPAYEEPQMKNEELVKFVELPVPEQIKQLNEWTEINMRKQLTLLQGIVEHESTHPFVQSLALLILKEQEINVRVQVKKFNHDRSFITTELLLPTQMPQYQYIENFLEEHLMQDPTALEMATYLLAKHAIAVYPYEWQPFEEDDIAIGYMQFVQAMFGKIQETDVEVQAFLQELELLTAIYDA